MRELLLSLRRTRSLVSRCALCCVVAVGLGAGFGQTQQNQTERLANAVAAARSGTLGGDDIDVIAKAGAATQVLSALEVRFTQTQDIDAKTMIAYALVKLGDRDNTYWNFLLNQAYLAVDSDLPSPFLTLQGKPVSREVTPELKAWAQPSCLRYRVYPAK